MLESRSGVTKTEEIKKVEPTKKKNNVIKLDSKKKEPKIFEEKLEETKEEKPLILKID